MAPTPDEDADSRTKCPNCGSRATKFKYFNNNSRNKKNQQPRYECLDCHTKFTLGEFGRKKPQHYAKKRNQDPPELRGKTTICGHCGDRDHARFKYYNNKLTCGFTQPRFLCLNENCKTQFQMHFDGINLVPNKSKKVAKVQPQQQVLSPETLSEPWMIPIASTSCYNYDVVNVEQSDRFSSTDDEASSEHSAPMEQSSEGGQYSYTKEMMMASMEQSSEAGQYSYTQDMMGTSAFTDQLPETDIVSMEQSDVDRLPTVLLESMDVPEVACQILSDDGASAYANIDAANADEVDQPACNSDDQSFFDVLAVPMEHGDAGQYSSAYECEVDVEQGDRLLDTDYISMEQSDVDWLSTMMDEMDAAEMPFQIPSDDAASPCDENEVMNAEQVDQFSNTDAVLAMMEPSDVGQNPSQAADEVAARAISFPICHVGQIPCTQLVAAAISELVVDAVRSSPVSDDGDMAYFKDDDWDDFDFSRLDATSVSLWDPIVF